jgi:hypothetical protein
MTLVVGKVHTRGAGVGQLLFLSSVGTEQNKKSKKRAAVSQAGLSATHMCKMVPEAAQLLISLQTAGVRARMRFPRFRTFLRIRPCVPVTAVGSSGGRAWSVACVAGSWAGSGRVESLAEM